MRGQGYDEEKEGEEEDEERRRGGARAEQRQDSSERDLTVKYDGRGISMLPGTFSCPLDVAAPRLEFSTSHIQFIWGSAARPNES